MRALARSARTQERPAASPATLAAALALLAPAAAGSDPQATGPATADPAPSPGVLEEVVISAPEPRYVAPTTRDRIGRIWAPVLVNGRGPYRFVLDTGASRSAVTQAVVDELGLPVKANAVRVQGVTGSVVASTVRAQTLEFGELRVEDTTMPIVADAFGGAQGVLGGEGLEDMRIVIEFRRDRISIMRSHRIPAPPGYSVVPFRYHRDRGMRVEATVGRVKAIALIDTGAQATVGNLALRRALARRSAERDTFDEGIVGVSEHEQDAARVRIPGILAGDLIVRNAEILFSDLYIFRHWKLEDRPALLIGMDVLGVLEALVIDYGRRELQVRIRR